ncbi:unnamed protein product [Menidia menidia]|uniref:(Atlantic silverside) hypothetical protein n=1 Tax=Menidia menidia TaxID=238744 RepID=A0A8S4BXI3_9TELE|nr:unnamed protein product [Menidia menidia]
MSLRMKQSNGPASYLSSGGFSSRSMGSCSVPRKIPTTNYGAPITAVTINKSLLTPMKIDIDPNVQVVRTQEKEQIKTLNNRFVSFIDKVQRLEQENKMLETKLKLLQGQAVPSSNTEPMLKAYIASLQRQLEDTHNYKHTLQAESTGMFQKVDEYKAKYEEEINKRTDAENEFVVLKKDLDAGYMNNVDLDSRVSSIRDEVCFLKELYDTEVQELQQSMKDTCVVVQMDNSRGLDMDQIVSDVRAQYEDIAARSREEAEAWHKTKLNQISAEATQYDGELRNTKAEIAEFKRMITRLQREIEAAKAQVSLRMIQA